MQKKMKSIFTMIDCDKIDKDIRQEKNNSISISANVFKNAEDNLDKKKNYSDKLKFLVPTESLEYIGL